MAEQTFNQGVNKLVSGSPCEGVAGNLAAVVATTGGAVSSGSSGSSGIPKTAVSPFSRRNYSNNNDLRINSEKNLKTRRATRPLSPPLV